MNNSRYTDSLIIKDILAGNLARDKALKYLLLKSDYPDNIKRVVEDGGGNSFQVEKIIEDCLVLLDRKVRRFELKAGDPLAEFFEKAAKQFWSEELLINENARKNVLNLVNKDEKLKKQIYYAVTSNSGKIEDAEDCYQNGMILLDAKMKDGKYNGGAIKGFFYQLCFNIWRNELKKSKTASLEDSNKTEPMSSDDPASVLEKKEKADLLKQLFNELGDSCQKILHLKYLIIDQYSMEKIAQLMGFKNAQIASNTLSKCRKKLWDLLQEHKQAVQWKNNM
jgi:RNA polymerase sigma factor (sigma-70 family)